MSLLIHGVFFNNFQFMWPSVSELLKIIILHRTQLCTEHKINQIWPLNFPLKVHQIDPLTLEGTFSPGWVAGGPCPWTLEGQESARPTPVFQNPVGNSVSKCLEHSWTNWYCYPSRTNGGASQKNVLAPYTVNINIQSMIGPVAKILESPLPVSSRNYP